MNETLDTLEIKMNEIEDKTSDEYVLLRNMYVRMINEQVLSTAEKER